MSASEIVGAVIMALAFIGLGGISMLIRHREKNRK
jgi:hypothetical protein